MRKRIIVFLLTCLLILSACDGQNALSVSFSDATSSGSTSKLIKVVYQEERDYEDKQTDILIKSGTDNFTFTITRELGESYTLNLPSSQTYYSLTKLIADRNLKTASFINYTDALSVSYILTSQGEGELTFLAIVGEDNNNEMLANSFEVSRPFSLQFEQKK